MPQPFKAKSSSTSGIRLRTGTHSSRTERRKMWEGLCIGYDGGDAVSSEYKPKFEFSGGRIIKVVFDVADDVYIDVERHLAAAMARD
jgi:hypothetical protein